MLTFLFFTVLAFVLFSTPYLGKTGGRSWLYLLGFPLVVGLVLAVVSLLKVYFLYKLVVLLAGLALGLGTLHSVRTRFRR